MKVPQIPLFVRFLSVGAGVAVIFGAIVYVAAFPVAQAVQIVAGLVLVFGGIFGGPL